jgi:DNA-directed RNA polymerase subunit RPC12/RpoP
MPKTYPLRRRHMPTQGLFHTDYPADVHRIVTEPGAGHPLLPPVSPRRRVEWVCEHCGAEGETQREVDTVQCPTCGEPVVPVTRRP